ncbi:MAG: twin-arginine translocase subunit TatB [Rhodocyclales bacterium]|nr:twin-arginine translocase subunit TatB [Rhodocyclales bacterium]
MFDFGFGELMVVALVALIVIGPERLPKVARTVGHLLGRVQRYVSDVKSDISREMQLEDLKKLQQQVEQQARELEGSFRGQVQSFESDMNKTAAGIKNDLSVDSDKPPTPSGPAAGKAPVSDAQPVAAERIPLDSGPQLELGLDKSVPGSSAEKT